MEDNRLRVMTYNIHSCVGAAECVSPEVTAEAIRQVNPDVAALQEVDDGIPRTGRMSQARYLSEILKMGSYFCSTVLHAEGRYGLAVISRFEKEVLRCELLPTLWPFRLQRRGAVHIALLTPVGRIHIFNTHLSLLGLERRLQLGKLMGERWLGSVPADEPIVFCGDLNASPASRVYRRLASVLTDVQRAAPRRLRRARATFSSRRPLLRIDHIFVSAHLKVLSSVVPDQSIFQRASDHLPVYADLAWHRTADSGAATAAAK
jgi:endonuclease/exonuclease/phosphatase family metal-dependent hydrolase